jgi:hypothetical protein
LHFRGIAAGRVFGKLVLQLVLLGGVGLALAFLVRHFIA